MIRVGCFCSQIYMESSNGLQVSTVPEIVLLRRERLNRVSLHVSLFIFAKLRYDNVCQRFWCQNLKIVDFISCFFSFSILIPSTFMHK